MGLAAAIGADEEQPALRVLSEAARGLESELKRPLFVLGEALPFPEAEGAERLMAVNGQRGQLVMISVTDRPPVIRSQDMDVGYDIGIGEPGAEPALQFLHRKVGRRHERKPVDVAVVEDLE